MKPQLPYQLRKNQTIALVVLGLLVVFFRLGFSYFKKYRIQEEIIVNFISNEHSPSELILTEFNPNELDEKSWRQLGFTQKQAQTILKYKEIIGGTYISKEQLKKCYAISEEKFEMLKDYILLPETNKDAKSTAFTKQFAQKKSLNIKGKFNPDTYSVKDWIELGFSENQSNAILKYKKYLGGSFISKEKFKECFIISEENYHKLVPYLILPEKSPQNIAKAQQEREGKSKINYQNFDPNALSQQEWQELGFSEKQAEVIINYKNKKLGGNFQSLEDVKNCFVISEKKFEEMKPYIRINPIKNIERIQKSPTEQSKKETTNFAEVDLNTITTEQLVEFGFDRKQAYSYLSFREKLGGFVHKNQVYEVYNIDRNLAEKLVAACRLNTQSVERYTLATAPESWLKTHPYFKYSADKIIFYRITYPDDKKIWKFIKVKPEYEAKMRLYLH